MLLTGLQEIVHGSKEGGCGQSNWLVFRHTPDCESPIPVSPFPTPLFVEFHTHTAPLFTILLIFLPLPPPPTHVSCALIHPTPSSCGDTCRIMMAYQFVLLFETYPCRVLVCMLNRNVFATMYRID